MKIKRWKYLSKLWKKTVAFPPQVLNNVWMMDEEGNEIEGDESACFKGYKHGDGVCYKKDGICTWDKFLLSSSEFMNNI